MCNGTLKSAYHTCTYKPCSIFSLDNTDPTASGCRFTVRQIQDAALSGMITTYPKSCRAATVPRPSAEKRRRAPKSYCQNPSRISRSCGARTTEKKFLCQRSKRLASKLRTAGRAAAEVIIKSIQARTARNLGSLPPK